MVALAGNDPAVDAGAGCLFVPARSIWPRDPNHIGIMPHSAPMTIAPEASWHPHPPLPQFAYELYESYHAVMPSEIEVMNTSTLRDNLYSVVERAKRGIPTIGAIRNKRTFAVVPIEVLDAYLQGQTRELRELIHARQGEPTIDLTDELDAAVTAVQETDAPDEGIRMSPVIIDQEANAGG